MVVGWPVRRRRTAAGSVAAALAVLGLSGCMAVGADAPGGRTEVKPSGTGVPASARPGGGQGARQTVQHGEHGGALSLDGASPGASSAAGVPVPGSTPPPVSQGVPGAPVQVPAASASGAAPSGTASAPVSAPSSPPAGSGGSGGGGTGGSPSPQGSPSAPSHSAGPSATPSGAGSEGPSESPSAH